MKDKEIINDSFALGGFTSGGKRDMDKKRAL